MDYYTSDSYFGRYVATSGGIAGEPLITSVPTQPGRKYIVSFNFKNTGTKPNQTRLTFGGVRILKLVDSYYPSWVVSIVESNFFYHSILSIYLSPLHSILSIYILSLYSISRYCTDNYTVVSRSRWSDFYIHRDPIYIL